MGTGPITPLRMRIYYRQPPKLGSGQAVEPIPAGLQLIGGNKDAASPSANPHLRWTCGQTKAIDTPTVNHPYNCDPYFRISTDVDGPVGIVDLPYCWTGVGTTDDKTVYPEADGGPDTTICDGSNPKALVQLSMRLHLGRAWSDTRDPCGDCAAYNLDNMRYSCAGGVCGAKLKLAAVPFLNIDWDQLAQQTYVDVRASEGLDTRWNSPDAGWQVFSVSQSTSTVTVTLPSTFQATACMRGCGSVATHVDPASPTSENFTLAGGIPPNPDSTHAFFTLHADFWNTWNQDVLDKLNRDWVIAPVSACGGGGQVNNNKYVDDLP